MVTAAAKIELVSAGSEEEDNARPRDGERAEHEAPVPGESVRSLEASEYQGDAYPKKPE
jgi:hypothetical protein